MPVKEDCVDIDQEIIVGMLGAFVPCMDTVYKTCTSTGLPNDLDSFGKMAL